MIKSSFGLIVKMKKNKSKVKPIENRWAFYYAFIWIHSRVQTDELVNMRNNNF